tara:strand:- start:1213 stop:2175 length:963 start_codon:yes stop_codon:yes gene_type:complete
MKLFNTKKKNIKNVDRKPFKNEREIQTLVENNMEEFLNLEFVCSEYSIDGFRLDSIGFDHENKCFVIVEYKKGSSYSVVDQGSTYLSIMYDRLSDFILEYNDRTGSNLKKKDVDFTQSRVVFISTSFNSYQKNSINFSNIPFELYVIKKYSNDIVSFDKIVSTPKGDFRKLTKGKNKKVDSVISKVKVFTEQDLVDKLSKNKENLWTNLKDNLENWEDINFIPKKHYIGFWKDNKVVSYIHFKNGIIVFHVIRGNIYPDKSKSKTWFELDDPKKMSKVISRNFTGRDGVVYKHEYYKIPFSNINDLDHILLLIKQKYNSL